MCIYDVWKPQITEMPLHPSGIYSHHMQTRSYSQHFKHMSLVQLQFCHPTKPLIWTLQHSGLQHIRGTWNASSSYLALALKADYRSPHAARRDTAEKEHAGNAEEGTAKASVGWNSYLWGGASRWDSSCSVWRRSLCPAAEPEGGCVHAEGARSEAPWRSSGCTPHRAPPTPARSRWPPRPGPWRPGPRPRSAPLYRSGSFCGGPSDPPGTRTHSGRSATGQRVSSWKGKTSCVWVSGSPCSVLSYLADAISGSLFLFLPLSVSLLAFQLCLVRLQAGSPLQCQRIQTENEWETASSGF